MKLYDINQKILECLDAETGEVLDEDALNALMLEREDKLENIALWCKQLTAESSAIADEIKALQERKKARERRAESIRAYLEQALEGRKFSTSKVECSFRKSIRVCVDDETGFIAWAKTHSPDLLTVVEPKISKANIKTALTDGAEIPHCFMQQFENLSIK